MSLGSKLTLNATVEPGLRPGRGGPRGREPQRRRDVLPGEAAVLRRGLVDLQLRQPGRERLLGLQLAASRRSSTPAASAARRRAPCRTPTYSDVPVGHHDPGRREADREDHAEPRTSARCSALTGGRTRGSRRRRRARRGRPVEPLTYYGVLRGQKEFQDRRTGLGVLATTPSRSTSTTRRWPDQFNRSVAAPRHSTAGTFLDKSQTWVRLGLVGDVARHGARRRTSPPCRRTRATTSSAPTRTTSTSTRRARRLTGLAQPLLAQQAEG